jgi:peptidoglycan DL-endopeptidase CwlO
VASDNTRRLWAGACIAAATTFTVPALPALPAHAAAAKPSPAQLQKKLDKLNEQVDQIVEKYNQAKEDLKVAKAKLKSAKAASERELKSYEDLRKKLAEMAATAYKSGEFNDVAGFLGTGDPQAVLDQTAVLSHLARNRNSEISLFLAAAQRLERQQRQAQDAYNDVNERTKKLRAERDKVNKAIEKQKKLLEKAGVTPDPSGGPIGGKYPGPATGKARVALNFA